MAAQVNGDETVGHSIFERVSRLEEFARETRERLARMESQLLLLLDKVSVLAARMDAMEQRMDAFERRMDTFVTKDALEAATAKLQESLARMELRLMRWFVVTMFASASLVFTAAQLLR